VENSQGGEYRDAKLRTLESVRVLVGSQQQSLPAFTELFFYAAFDGKTWLVSSLTHPEAFIRTASDPDALFSIVLYAPFKWQCKCTFPFSDVNSVLNMQRSSPE
jgi:hypothetical protein